MKMQYLWHCHHMRLIEPQNYPMRGRRAHIRAYKDETEVPLRLLLFRKAKIKSGVETYVVQKYLMNNVVSLLLKRLHKEQCEPDCPYSRQKGIFAKVSKSKGRYVTKTGK